MATTVTLSVDAAGLHGDLRNPLNHLDFSDDKGDTYDDPNDKTTFDTMLDSNDTVIWTAVDSKTNGKLSVTNIKIDSAPDGFFASGPTNNGDGTWQATVGNNTTVENMVCEYTITFNDGKGDAPVPIDPKLQIRKSKG